VSEDWIMVFVVCVLWALLILVVVPETVAYLRERRVRLNIPDERPTPPPEFRTFDHPWMQTQLQNLIDAYGIEGSCNIRHGRVMRVEAANERAHIGMALRIATENAIAQSGNNPNLAVCTHRDGRVVPIGDFVLADLLGFAMMLESKP
jgi:hypothetical protein